MLLLLRRPSGSSAPGIGQYRLPALSISQATAQPAASTSPEYSAYCVGMSEHHHHDHDHSELSETELRVRALETILTEKGYVDPAALDAIIQAYETKIGPHNGAQVVAKAWSDPAFKQALLEDATKAVSTLGHESRVGDHLV